MNAAVLRLYYADYIRAWDAMLADVRIAPFASLDQGARITNALADADSPLKAFLGVAARETTLEGRGRCAAVELEHGGAGKLSEARKKLEAALGARRRAGAGGDASSTRSTAFRAPAQAGRQAERPAAGRPARLDEGRIAVLRRGRPGAPRRHAGAGRRGPAEDQARRRRHAGAAGRHAADRRQRRLQPDPGQRARAHRGAVGGRRARFCRDAIAGRYPLVRSASRDATPDDFGKFFGPAA
jgi:type VI secretion system protein ImpL